MHYPHYPKASIAIEDYYKYYKNELAIVKTLDLNLYNDVQLQAKIQEILNIQYGFNEYTRCFSTARYPKRTCKFIKTVKVAKSALKKDLDIQLFWRKDIGESQDEKQWILDLGYLRKYKKKHGDIPWNDRQKIREYILEKRRYDQNVVCRRVYVMITTKSKYKHFSNKVKSLRVPPAEHYLIPPMFNPSYSPLHDVLVAPPPLIAPQLPQQVITNNYVIDTNHGTIATNNIE